MFWTIVAISIVFGAVVSLIWVQYKYRVVPRDRKAWISVLIASLIGLYFGVFLTEKVYRKRVDESGSVKVVIENILLPSDIIEFRSEGYVYKIRLYEDGRTEKIKEVYHD